MSVTSSTRSTPVSPSSSSSASSPSMASSGDAAWTVSSAWVHPIKGFNCHTVEGSHLSPGQGLAHDRAYAFAFASALPDGADTMTVSALAKDKVLQQNDWPALGRLRLRYDFASGTVEISDLRNPARRVVVDPDAPQGRRSLEAFLDAFLANETRAPGAHSKEPPVVRLVGSRAHPTRFPDRASADVTLVSTRTLADLERRFGALVDPRRFRINLHIDALPAWQEEGLVGKTLRIGQARLRVKGPVRRCFNIDTHPERGERDIPLLGWLKPNLGHVVVGVTALVETAGPVRAGDEVVLEDA